MSGAVTSSIVMKIFPLFVPMPMPMPHETQSVLCVDRPVEGAVAQHWHSTVKNSTVEQCWDTAAPAGISIASSTGTGSRKVGEQPIEGLNI